MKKRYLSPLTVMSVEIANGGKDKSVAQNSKKVQEKVPSGKNGTKTVQSDSLQPRLNEDSAQLGKNICLLELGEKASKDTSAKENDPSVVAIQMNEMTNGEEVLVQDGEGFFSQVFEAFNWDDFLYSLLFGLLPSTLDILTDFRFALLLDKSEQSLIAAGLAYAIIILPGIDFSFFFLFQKVWDNLGDSLRIKIPVLFIYVAIVGFLLGALLLSIIHMPTSLYYPALAIAVSLLGIKLLALVVHTPAIKKLSVMASGSEGNFESAYQLLLVFLTWMTGGGRHFLPMATSLLVIGKTRAERHLNSQPDLQMHEKTFEEKVVAVAAHIPIFSLAAVFRIGSLALIFGCLPALPDSVTSLILFQIVFFAVGSVLALLLLLLSRWHQPLGQLTALQACQGVIGECWTNQILSDFLYWLRAAAFVHFQRALLPSYVLFQRPLLPTSIIT